MSQRHTPAVVCMASFFLSAIAAAQQPNLDHYRISFVKTLPGKGPEYEAFLKQNLPLAQADIHAGVVRAWGFARVWSPTGMGADHNFIEIFAYEKWADMEPKGETAPEILAAYNKLGFAAPADYTAKASTLSHVVSSRVYRRSGGTERTEQSAPKVGDWLTVSFIKSLPGRGGDFANGWRGLIGMDEQRIQDGWLKSSSLWSVMGPGDGEEYNFIEFRTFRSFKEIGDPPGRPTAAEYAERAIPGKGKEMFQDLVSKRHYMHTEVVQIKALVQ